jgi:hypothetical protein
MVQRNSRSVLAGIALVAAFTFTSPADAATGPGLAGFGIGWRVPWASGSPSQAEGLGVRRGMRVADRLGSSKSRAPASIPTAALILRVPGVPSPSVGI